MSKNENKSEHFANLFVAEIFTELCSTFGAKEVSVEEVYDVDELLSKYVTTRDHISYLFCN